MGSYPSHAESGSGSVGRDECVSRGAQCLLSGAELGACSAPRTSFEVLSECGGALYINPPISGIPHSSLVLRQVLAAPDKDRAS